jgi:hypothetical protein
MNLDGDWSEATLTVLGSAVRSFRSVFSNAEVKTVWLDHIKITLSEIKYGGLTITVYVKLNIQGFTEWTVVHELAHAWDAENAWNLSREMKRVTGSHFPFKPIHMLFPSNKTFWYHVGSPPPPCGIDRNFNALEDFAESVTAFVYPDIAHQRAVARGYPYETYGFSTFQQTPRGVFVSQLISKN